MKDIKNAPIIKIFTLNFDGQLFDLPYALWWAPLSCVHKRKKKLCTKTVSNLLNLLYFEQALKLKYFNTIFGSKIEMPQLARLDLSQLGLAQLGIFQPELSTTKKNCLRMHDMCDSLVLK